MITEKDFDTALSYFETTFQFYKSTKELNFKKIVLCLTTLKYLERLTNNDYLAAYHILNKLDISYWNKEICISMYDNEDKIMDYNLEVNIIYNFI